MNIKLKALHIRPMTPADLPQVMAIETASYTAPWHEAAYRQAIAGEQSYFNVVTAANRIIGYSGMWHFVDEVHLGTIVSHPAMRGKGIGELLLVDVIARAIKLEATYVTLEVRPSNHPARALYEKYKFSEVGYRKHYYPDREDALLMTSSALNNSDFQSTFRTLSDALLARLTSFSIE